MFYVTGAGSIYRAYPTDSMYVRPVINIVSSAIVEGNGSKENPYYID